MLKGPGLLKGPGVLKGPGLLKGPDLLKRPDLLKGPVPNDFELRGAWDAWELPPRRSMPLAFATQEESQLAELFPYQSHERHISILAMILSPANAS